MRGAMQGRTRAAIAAVLVSITTPAWAEPATEPAADRPVPTEAELEARAQQAFAAGRYDEVVELAAQAFALTGQLRHLYAQAHAERFRGNCNAALGLYARVLAADTDGVLGQHAREGIKLCEPSIITAAPEPPPPVLASPPPPSIPPVSPRADARPRRRDPVGPLLLGAGVVGIAASASLAVVASIHALRLERASDERGVLDEQRRARAFEGAAIAVAVVGSGLLVGGIVRLVQGARRSGPRVRAATGRASVASPGAPRLRSASASQQREQAIDRGIERAAGR